MSTSVETKSSLPRLGDDSETFHCYCCDPDVSMCGFDIADMEEAELGEDDLCVVCEDLDQMQAWCSDPDCPLRTT